jgi:hypothetical protein
LFVPIKPLQPFVDCYWILLSDSEPLEVGESVFVDSKADIIFIFGCPYQRDELIQVIVKPTVGSCKVVPLIVSKSRTP